MHWRLSLKPICLTTLVFSVCTFTSSIAAADDPDPVSELRKYFALWDSEKKHDALSLLCSGFKPGAEVISRYLQRDSITTEVLDDNDKLETIDYHEKIGNKIEELKALIGADGLMINGVPYSEDDVFEIKLLFLSVAQSAETLCESATEEEAFYFELTLLPFYRFDKKDKVDGSARSVDLNSTGGWLTSAYVNRSLPHTDHTSFFFEGGLSVFYEDMSDTEPYVNGRIGFALTENSTSMYRPHEPNSGLRLVLGLDAERISTSRYGASVEIGFRSDVNKDGLLDIILYGSSLNSSNTVSTSTVDLGIGYRKRLTDEDDAAEKYVEVGGGIQYSEHDASMVEKKGRTSNIFLAYEAVTPFRALSVRTEIGYEARIGLRRNDPSYEAFESQNGYGSISLIYRHPPIMYKAVKRESSGSESFALDLVIPGRYRAASSRGSRRYLNRLDEF